LDSEFKKKLPKPYQPHVAEALALARELVENGEVYSRPKGKKERFFSSDPEATLDRLALAVLERGPMSQAALKQELKRDAPALAELFPGWWKAALSERRIFEQQSDVPKTKLFGTKPDRRLLAKPIEALKKALQTLEKAGLAKRDVSATCLELLGVSGARVEGERQQASESVASAPAAKVTNGGADRTTFLEALRALARRNPDGALLPVRELRTLLHLPKERFDATALALAKEGAVTLHYHDHAASLSAADRDELVEDERGTHYMGIAFRRRT
jgi:hypothetical protein